MVAALMMLLIVLVSLEVVERMVAMVTSDGLGHRDASALPRSHRDEALNPLR